MPVRDRTDGEAEEGLVDVVASLPADAQARGSQAAEANEAAGHFEQPVVAQNPQRNPFRNNQSDQFVSFIGFSISHTFVTP